MATVMATVIAPFVRDSPLM